MNRLLLWIRKVFEFSASEANGFIVIMILMVIVISAPFIYDHYLPETVYNNYESDQKLLDSLIKEMKADKTVPSKRNDIQLKESSVRIFDFDPNTSNESDLLALGLSRYVVKNILKYRDKGGRFRYKKDFSKLYGLSRSQYEVLSPYLLLPDTLRRNLRPSIVIKKYKIEKFDINTADTLQLQNLKGIGSVRSKRIIKFRDALGGFIDMTQLQEIYGMDSLSLTELNQFSFVTQDFIPKKINVNQSDQATMARHPYIGKQFSLMIVNYRNQHGLYRGIEDIRKIKEIPEGKMRNLEKYITF